MNEIDARVEAITMQTLILEAIDNMSTCAQNPAKL